MIFADVMIFELRCGITPEGVSSYSKFFKHQYPLIYIVL